MTGVKAFIRDSMPKSWEQALLDHKCIDKFIEQFYQGIAEEKNSVDQDIILNNTYNDCKGLLQLSSIIY